MGFTSLNCTWLLHCPCDVAFKNAMHNYDDICTMNQHFYLKKQILIWSNYNLNGWFNMLFKFFSTTGI